MYCTKKKTYKTNEIDYTGDDIFGAIVYLFKIVIGNTKWSIRHFVGAIIPCNYFIILYVVLYIISPYFNLIVDKLSKKQMKIFVLIVFGIFSIWSILVDLGQEILDTEWMGLNPIGMYGSQEGYTIVNFSLNYIIGAYLRKYSLVEKKKNQKTILFFVITVCAIFLTLWAKLFPNTAWEYCNPVVIIEAAALFLFFSKIYFYSRVINTLAKGAFTVFLLHSSFLKLINIKKFVNENPMIMIAHIIVSITLIYMVCWIAYFIYEKLTASIFRWMEQRFRFLSIDVYDLNDK